METHETTYIDSYETRVRKPGAGETALVTDYGTLDHYLEICKKDYEERRTDFFDSVVESEDLPEKAKRLASFARTYLGLARTILHDYGEFEKYHQAALDIADRVVKESGIVLRNLDLHYEHKKKELPKGDPDLLRLSKEVEDGIHFFSRAMATQIALNRREEAFTGGPAGIEMREEMKAGDRMRALEAKVPEDHMYLPARPFPPVPIPEEYQVPDYPEPYNRVIDVPVEEKVYDTEQEEFLIPEGYISEDGLIDDKSVVWHPETHEVEIGYRGGIRTVWNYKKFLDPREVWEPGSWAAEYQYRLFEQAEASEQMGLFLHREYEEAIPEYNRIPDGSFEK